MEKDISIKDFCEELIRRIEKNKTIDCCQAEVTNLAKMAMEHMGDKTIHVNWKEDS